MPRLPEPRGLKNVKTLASQSTILLSTGAVSYAGAFVLQLMLARALGASGFGAWIIAFAFVEGISAVGLMGGDWVLLRYGAYYHGVRDIPRLRSTILFALLVGASTLVAIAGTVFLLAQFIAVRFFANAALVPLLRLAAVSGVVVGIRQIFVYGTQAFKSVRYAAIVRGVLQPVLRLAFIAGAILLSATASSAFVGLLGAEIALTLIAGVLLHRWIPLRGTTEEIDRREMATFGLSVMGTRVAEAMRSQLFPLVLGSLVALSASGMYAAAKRITAAPGLIVNAMNQVYNPIASDLFLRGERSQLAHLTKSMTRWTASIILPLFGVVVVFPKEILSLFGQSFRPATSSLIVMAVGMLFLFATGPVSGILNIAGRPRLSLADYLAAMTVEVILAFWLIPRYGLLGAAIAGTVGRIINNLVPLVQVWWILKLHPYRVDFWKPIVSATAAVILAKLVHGALPIQSTALSTGISVGAAFVGYMILMLLFGTSEEDKAMLAHIFHRIGKGRYSGSTTP